MDPSMDPRHFYSYMPHNVPALPILPSLRYESCQLAVTQQPEEALITTPGKEKARKPLDPPPICEFMVGHDADPNQQFLQNPYIFATVSLVDAVENLPYDGSGETSLCGTLVSSLNCLKDHHNKNGGFFVWGDISVKVAGNFRLRFTVHEFQQGNSPGVVCLGQAFSAVFKVRHPKDFQGLRASTLLSRSFSEQGVRLRIRKTATNKRPFRDCEEETIEAEPVVKRSKEDVDWAAVGLEQSSSYMGYGQPGVGGGYGHMGGSGGYGQMGTGGGGHPW
jgi:hypothetical protein